MDPELRDLLNRIGELNAEELADLDQRLGAYLEQIRAEDLTDDVLALMTETVDGIEAVRAETATREAAAAERQARADELLARVAPEDPPAEDPPAGEVQDPPADPPAEDPPADPPAGEQPTPEAVAAAAARPARPPLGAIAARRPVVAARPRSGALEAVLTAAGDVPGVPAGARIRSMLDLAVALQKRHNAIKGPASGYEQIPVATFRTEYPKDRVLGEDARANKALIAAVTSLEAIVASGGLCAPLTPQYTLQNISTAARPLRDSLAQFGVTRGGIQFMPSPVITDFAGAVDFWTVANDADPQAPHLIKPCLHVACDGPVSVEIEAITRCLEFGNLGARAWPEQVQNAIELTMAFHARLAERRLLGAIYTNSTKVTAGTVLGTARDVLATIDRASAGYRNRHRTVPEMPLRLLIPDWLDDNIRTDLARELPGSSSERLAVADAQIDAFFAVRNINLTRLLEGRSGSGQDWAAQGAGALIGWPTNVEMALFAEGTHLFLDGGMLDIGLVRDSTLNNTNDYRIFGETFEALATPGIESLWITQDICPNGQTSGTSDIDPCTTGS